MQMFGGIDFVFIWLLYVWFCNVVDYWVLFWWVGLLVGFNLCVCDNKVLKRFFFGSGALC